MAWWKPWTWWDDDEPDCDPLDLPPGVFPITGMVREGIDVRMRRAQELVSQAIREQEQQQNRAQ